nr:immunoglobulin light chain junction region [Macaca mulatta]MOW16022.1 immunoglobulin light chain junction region [Macaca mulatta]
EYYCWLYYSGTGLF